MPLKPIAQAAVSITRIEIADPRPRKAALEPKVHQHLLRPIAQCLEGSPIRQKPDNEGNSDHTWRK